MLVDVLIQYGKVWEKDQYGKVWEILYQANKNYIRKKNEKR